MKTAHKLGIGSILALCMIVGVAAVWSLGAAASVDVPTIRVETVQGTVEVKRLGDADFTSADASFQVQPGDEVRTGADGKASIRWGDRGETRLDENTDLTIVSAPADGTATKALIELKLSSGRAWSRVLKLLDVDSGFDVKTDGVVATVRGTAFGVAKADADSQLAVTESVVDVAPVNGGVPTLLKEGKWGNFDAAGSPTIVRNLEPTDAWPNDNKKLDDAFDAQLRQELLERFKRQDSAAPDWLVEFSQGIHLALVPGDAREGLVAKYINWRIAQAVDDPSNADRLLSFDRSWFSLGPEARDRVLGNLRFALFVTAPRPGVPASPLFAKFQNLRTQFLNTPYADALLIDDQIDALIFPVAPLSPEDRLAQGNHLLQVIQDWKNGLQDVGLSSDERAKLDAKADALTLRLAEDGVPVPPPSPEATSTSPTVEAATPTPTPTPSGTKPSSNIPSTISSPPVTQTCTYQSFLLLAKPANNVAIGQAVGLSLYGTCTNGQMDDLTSSSGFSAASADGSVSGYIFTPSHVGTITVFGTHGSKTVSAAVTVVGSTSTAPKGKTLSSVSAGAIGPTNLTTGQSAPLTATAHYSDGSTSDVVYQCNWTTSNSQLGSVSGQRFYAGNGTGSVDAICSYTEGGITKTGSVTFTISLDPSLVPTSGGTTRSRSYNLNNSLQ